jgi:hypothetical protein
MTIKQKIRSTRSNIMECPRCGLIQAGWAGDGYPKDDATYCCEGCARETGCTCPGAQKEKAAPEQTEPTERAGWDDPMRPIEPPETK